MSDLRARAEKFLRRPNPLGRRAGNQLDEIIARFVAGGPWDDRSLALLQQMARFNEMIDRYPLGLGVERDAYMQEMFEILRGIHAEVSSMPPGAGQGMRDSQSQLWKALIPPENPPQYVSRPMNSHERRLIALLRSALEDGIEDLVRRFDEEYWVNNAADEIPYDTRIGEAIHDFAHDIQDYTPNEEHRRDVAGLFGLEGLRARVLAVLALLPPDMAD